MRSRLRNLVAPVAVSWLFAALWSGCYEAHEGEAERPMGSLAGALAEAPQRLDITLLPGSPPVATHVEVERPAELTEDEVIGTSVVAPGFGELVPGAECRGSLVTEMTPELRFSVAETTFVDGREAISCLQFVERVRERVDAGEAPFLFAERPAPAEPQEPRDPTFAATRIQIAGDVSPREILEINADADNLAGCEQLGSPPEDCLGLLEVLGLDVVLQESVTRIELDPRARLDR